MKKILYKLFAIIFTFIMSASTYADPVSISKARSIAQSLLKGKNLTLVNSVSQSKARSAGVCENYLPYYIFNADDEGGFAIVAGNDELSSIIGYADEGSFNSENMHPALKSYLDFCTQYIDDVEAEIAFAPKRASETPGQIIVAPICKSEWGQDAPFNLYCPDNSPCGCVATAMAQIMRHWKWPNVGRGKVTYNSTYYKVLSKDLSTSTYDWDSMLNKGGQIRNAAAREAMGTITYDAGLSVKMDYSPTGSGATDENARVSLSQNFQYDATTIDLQRRICYSSQTEWMNLVKKELLANRPILYCAQDTSGLGGHAFVVDGFDSNDFVHVNWGWDGMSNGFYNIVTLAPDSTSYAFASTQSMILGIQPDYSEQEKQVGQYRLYMGKSPSCKGSLELGKPFKVYFNSIYNVGYDSHTYTIGVGLYDTNASFISEISTPSSTIDHSYTQQFKPFYGWNEFDIAAKMDSSTPDGQYALRCVFHEKGYDEWMLPDMVGGTELNWVPVLVKDGKVFLNSSEGAAYPTSINAVFDDSPSTLADGSSILYKEYYDLQGRRLPSDASNGNLPSHRGVLIVKQYLSDGKVVSKKFLCR